MNIVDKYTGYIAIQAHTNSEWDTVNAAILQVSDADIIRWSRWSECSVTLNRIENDFAHIVYYDSVDFVNIDEDIEDNKLYHIEIDKNQLSYPDQKLDTYMVKFFGDGTMRFLAYGKNTGDEFYTDIIDIEELKNLIKTN